MDQMPLELVVNVFEYLPQCDLRNTTSVCRLFYQAAQDAGCSIRRTIDFTRAEEVERMLATFEALVKHATRKPSPDRPGIALRLVVLGSQTKGGALKPGMHLVLKALEESLRLLVELDAFVDTCFLNALYRALCSAPAPRLRTLALQQSKYQLSPTIPPPDNIFKKTVPRLRTLCLDLPTLEAEWKAVDAFKRVRTAHVTIHEKGRRPISISSLLPYLQSLTITLWDNKGDAGTQPALDLSGRQLDHLALTGLFKPASISGIDYRKIAIIEYGADAAIANSVWATVAADNVPLCARIAPAGPSLIYGDRKVVVTVTGDSWARMVHCGLSEIAWHPLPLLGTQLALVLLDCTFLDAFLSVPATMSALLALYIDVASRHGLCSVDSGAGSGLSLHAVRLACPAVESVTLFTLSRPLPLRSDRIAVLGQMLKLEERPTESRAALQLVNVEFVRPTARKRLDCVFPTIRYSQALEPRVLKLVESCQSWAEKTSVVPR
ncbi:hypothetical protein AURDEDRAFT_184031 [Auricularia subglabra TFB-10046 SS5]|nr:hypothetical protein AURDEDRAFT_184031 [Auricularia subglabra TFB-10046 SS5]